MKHIAKKRQEMIESGKIKGLTNKDTLKISRELDHLLNCYMGTAS